MSAELAESYAVLEQRVQEKTAALNNMSAELAESYAVLEQRVQEKTAGLEHKNQILSFLWQANRRLHSRAPLCERLSPVLNGLQNLTLLRDIELNPAT